MFKRRPEGGFTLIEMLVVIAIIGMLASVILVRLSEARGSAKYARARSDIKTLADVINIARIQKGGHTLGITHSSCTECDCRGKGNIQNLPKTDSCWTSYVDALRLINNATNYAYRLNIAPADPWGAPYLFDENEDEGGWPGGDCYKDSIASAGPNGLYYDTDDIVYNLDTVCSPTIGVHQPNVNWPQ